MRSARRHAAVWIEGTPADRGEVGAAVEVLRPLTLACAQPQVDRSGQKLRCWWSRVAVRSQKPEGQEGPSSGTDGCGLRTDGVVGEDGDAEHDRVHDDVLLPDGAHVAVVQAPVAVGEEDAGYGASAAVGGEEERARDVELRPRLKVQVDILEA